MPAKYVQGRVEYRPGYLDEVRSIGKDGGPPVIPALLYLPADQWSAAVEGLDMRRTAAAPFGSGILAISASPRGDVIIAGRDAFGRPAVPVPTDDGLIRFARIPGLSATNPEPVDPNTGPPQLIPKATFDRPEAEPWKEALVEEEPCTLVLDENGKFTCRSRDCGRCLPAAFVASSFAWISCRCMDLDLNL